MVLAEGKARAKAQCQACMAWTGRRDHAVDPRGVGRSGKDQAERPTTEGLVCHVLQLWLMEENVVRAEGAGS